ncbi:hypothetical protein ODZ45_08780 [Escherichia coli]|nr:hypothetical protein [Escherichia coli]
MGYFPFSKRTPGTTRQPISVPTGACSRQPLPLAQGHQLPPSASTGLAVVNTTKTKDLVKTGGAVFFLVKLTIAIVIVCAILSPILISPHNKLSTLFWKIPNAFWIFLICIYFAIAMAVLIESSEQTRIRRQQYFQQYEVPNETHKNVVIENSIKSQLI